MVVTTNTNTSWLFWAEAMVVPLYLFYRAYTSCQLPILTDCDEVYNYWEPLHYLLFHNGQQTWEYAHEYALRTYAYLVPLQWFVETIVQYPTLSFLIRSIGMVISSPSLSSSLSSSVSNQHLQSHKYDDSNLSQLPFDPKNKIHLFLLLRVVLCLITTMAELRWLDVLSTKHIPSGTTKTIVAGTTLLLLTSTGMHHASSALLPSASTWITVWYLCATSFLQHQHATFVIVAVLGTLMTAWPFGCVVVIPMAIHILYKEWNTSKVQFLKFMIWIVFLSILVQVWVLWIDSGHYGKITSATWNIFVYNAAGSGDELYGTEPISYYIKNLFLNLNLAAPLGCLAIPVYLLVPSLQKQQTLRIEWDLVTMLLSVPIWLAITVPRPHKEERFLFPVYPILIFGAVLTVDTIVNRLILPITTTSLRQRRRMRLLYHLSIWIPIVMLSFSRTSALFKYYHAPLEIYSAIPRNATGLVCTCGEWYRFPSSFYLPKDTRLGYLPSTFTGQLPQAFSEYGSRPQSQSILQPFNDRNLEQRERYVDPFQCRWMVDLAKGDCVSQFDTKFKTNVIPFLEVPFLDAARTTSTIHRILYIPYLHELAVKSGNIIYDKYVLYQIVSGNPTSE